MEINKGIGTTINREYGATVFYSAEAVFPIMTYSPKEKRRTGLLGTGFFINANGVALTAKHVIKGYKDRQDELLVMLVDRERTVYNLRPTIIHESKGFDIAALKVPDVQKSPYFFIGGKQIHNNLDYVAVEYSRTSFERDSINGSQTTFWKPYVHKGNVMITYVSEYPETTPTKTIEVSFPVLQGGSGAPLFQSDNPRYVIGMLIYSVEHERTPAQVVSIKDGNNYSEETKYFIQFGRAIHFEHLSDFIQELKRLELFD